MLSRRLLGGVLVAGALVPVGVGAAAERPTANITLGGRGFAAPVTVRLQAPPGYSPASGNSRSWKGPRWKKLASATEGDSSLDFGAHPDFSARSAEEAARRKLGGAGEAVASGARGVPHVVKGRTVGTARGFYVIMHDTRQGYEGWYKAALALPLGKGYPLAVVDFAATRPSSDASETVEGKAPSAWNRQVIEQALAGIAVVGNLAPQRIEARLRRYDQEPCCPFQISGRALDTLGHPLVGVKVTLRKHGEQPCCNATTSVTGAYTLNVPKRAGSGAFVLSVTLGTATVAQTIKVP